MRRAVLSLFVALGFLIGFASPAEASSGLLTACPEPASFVYDTGPSGMLGVEAKPAGATSTSTLGVGVAVSRSSRALQQLLSEQVAPRTTPELARPSTIANAGAPIRSFVTQTDTVYYRVYSGDSTVGGFLTSAPPRSSAEAIRSLALPPGNQAAYVQEVLVPAGTRLQSSLATEAFGQPGGALQLELLDRIPIANLGPGSPLG